MVSPPQLTAQVQLMLKQFALVGNLEYFRITKPLKSEFGTEITLKYSPLCRQQVLGKMLFDKHGDVINLLGLTDPASAARENQGLLVKRLQRFIGSDARFQSVAIADKSGNDHHHHVVARAGGSANGNDVTAASAN